MLVARGLLELQEQLSSLASLTFKNEEHLNLMTGEKGGPYLYLKLECSHCINQSGQVEVKIKIPKAELTAYSSMETPCLPGHGMSLVALSHGT